MINEYITLYGKRLYGLCVKLCGNTVDAYRDLLRKQKRSPVYDIFSTTEEKDTLMENVIAAEKTDYSDLHAAVDRLPAKMRVTVILHYFHGLDETKTAAALGVPVGTVKTRLLRLASLLVCLCFLVCSALLFPEYPALALACVVFVILSLAANGIISIVFYKTGFIPE